MPEIVELARGKSDDAGESTGSLMQDPLRRHRTRPNRPLRLFPMARLSVACHGWCKSVSPARMFRRLGDARASEEPGPLSPGASVQTTAVTDWNMVTSRNLFEREVPLGFHYRDNFITDAEERLLLEAIADVAFADFEMRGVVARRRVAFFGQPYDRTAAGPFPGFLLPLRAQIANWANIEPDAFAMALINGYVRARPSAGIATRLNTTWSAGSRSCRPVG